MQQCKPYDCPKGASSGKVIQKEEIPAEKPSGHPKSLAVTGQTGRIRVDFSDLWTQVLKSGNETGHNNSNLTLQDASVECSEMGTISNDGSHLCFYPQPIPNHYLNRF